ncbi:MAG: amino acid ABC transporter permease, partial [Desulfotignum sp.]|nr:amino acid ABC transporter permease [Desulfotignum sp.]
MGINTIDKQAIARMKPPVVHRGAVGWLKDNLFNGFFNSILTLVVLAFLLKFVPPFLKWAFIDSVWFTSGAVCKECSGACWSVV